MEINKTIKHIIVIFGGITLFALVLILFLDFINIRNYIPFTGDFDWLNLLGAIIGGLIGAIGTFFGIYLTIINEREENRKKEIEDKKRTGYSYLAFSDTPLTFELSLDSYTGIDNLDEKNNLLIGENVNAEYTNFCDMTFEFSSINSNYPTGVVINDLKILFDYESNNNRASYKEIVNLHGYKNIYKPITMKNQKVLSFASKVLINEETLKLFNSKLIPSQKIDVIANISFINPSGVITEGTFSSNLLLDNSKKIGNKKIFGSNKIKNFYIAENTYLTINKIEYVEKIDEVLFK